MDALSKRLLGTTGLGLGSAAIGMWLAFILAMTPFEIIGSLIAWAALGGPLFVVAVLPLGAQDTRLWPRRMSIAAASLSPALFLAILGNGVANGRALEPPFLFLLALAFVHAALLVRARSRLSPPILALGLALGVLPFTRELAGIAFLVLEVVAMLILAPFRRSFDAWVKAAAGAAVTIVLGLGLLVALRGSLFPPRLVLDDQGVALFILPLVLLALVVFAVTLARRSGQPSSSLP